MKKIMFNDRYFLTKAVLQHRKTMTRRLVPQKLVAAIEGHLPGYAVMESKYKVGEIVAVAQSYKDTGLYDVYRGAEHHAGWNNKMFVRADLMPHQIRITNIKVERLQDISDEDCLREGIEEYASCCECGADVYSFDGAKETYYTPREAFAALIDKVSGNGTWESNPWVFVYEFELIN